MTAVDRLEGRTWFARTAAAVLPVLALGALDDPELRAVAAIAVLWVPVITLTQLLQRRLRTVPARAVATVVDLGALAAIARAEPGLLPFTIVLAASIGMVHARDLGIAHRLLVGVAIVTSQFAAGVDSAETVALVTVVDAIALAVGALLWGEQDRERRRTDAALDRAGQLTEAVLTGIGEAIVVTDASGRIQSSNEAAEITFGAPTTGTCQAALGLHRGPETLDCASGCPLLDPETGVGQAEVSRDHPGGARQALLANVRAVRSPTGRVREVVHSYRDVTALKEAEQAKALFLATASHELKTPIAVITGFAALLDQENVTEEQRATAVRTIRSRGRELTEVVDRLLLVSRIDGGDHRLRTQPTELRPLLTDRVDDLCTSTERPIRLTLPADLPAVDADGKAFVTVLDHLVENAVKYSPGGEPVDITVSVHDHEVHLEVSDEGIGMSARDVEHCFDVFWQAEGHDTRRFGGSGLGLYIVRALCRAMDAEVEVAASVPGHGTTMRVRLARTDARKLPGVAATRPASEGAMIDEFIRQVGASEDRQ